MEVVQSFIPLNINHTPAIPTSSCGDRHVTIELPSGIKIHLNILSYNRYQSTISQIPNPTLSWERTKSWNDKIVCYLSFLLYIMILWFSSFFLECILFEAQNLSFCTQFFINFSVDSQVFGILDI